MYNMQLRLVNNPLDEPSARYHHADFYTRRRVCRFLLRVLGFTVFAKVAEVNGLENIPADGPAILMMNHIGFIDHPAVLDFRGILILTDRPQAWQFRARRFQSPS